MKKGKIEAKRRRLDSASWGILFEVQGSSGLSIKDFCASQGVCLASYYRRRKQLQEGRKPKAGVLIPIEIQAKSSEGIMVELPGGVLLHFAQLPPVAYLRELSSKFSSGML